MLVKKSALVALYAALNLDTVGAWPLAKLVQKTNAAGGIGRYREPGQAIADPAAEALFDLIVADQVVGNLIEVEDDTPAPTDAPTMAKPAPKAAKPATPAKESKPKPAPKAKAPAGKRQPAARYEGFGNWKAYAAHLAKNPKPLDEKKGGVMVATVKALKAAGRDNKPITKEELLGVLAAEFPDRDRSKMEVTINNNVPGRLRWMHGIEVSTGKNDAGRRTYWIGGKVTVPAKAAPAKPAAAPKPAPKKPAAKPAPKSKKKAAAK